MKGRFFFLIFVGYVIASFGLFLYSYTQVDLSLTLSQVSIWQVIQKSFQHIGYYQRPVSAGIYLGLLFLFFGLYMYTLFLAKKHMIRIRQLWKIIFAIVVLLVFSYPAFSYDIFNYMFDAKTVLIYHKIPYTVTPLQFVGVEPWLSFLHWTHVPSVYGPFWILFTLIPYLLGFGYFLVILWNMKILMAIFYLLAVWTVGAILEQIDKNNTEIGMAIFALNPLVIIESLVNGHNDIVMMAFALIAFFFYLKKDIVLSFFFFAASIATKLVTGVLFPLYIMRWTAKTAFFLMIIGLSLFLLLTHREVMPWYCVWVMPFVALLPRRVDFLLLAGGVSFGLLLRYAPFLYFGHWDPPVPMIKDVATFASIAVAFSAIGLLYGARWLFALRSASQV